MDIKNVTDILKANGVKINANYAHVLRDGCVKEYQDLLDETVSKVEEYARYGVNEGFSGDLKDNIEALTNIAVKLTKEKNGKKLSNYTNDFSKINKETAKLMEKNAQSVNVVNEVIKYVDSYIQGAKTLAKTNSAESRKDILTQSVTKLEQLKSALLNVADVSTVTAGEYAKKIIALLKTWSKQVSIQMHDSSTVGVIDDAIAAANSWAEVKVGVSKGLFKKSNKLTSLDGINFVKDDMYMIGLSEGVLEKINIFSSNLQEYKSSVEGGRYNTDADEAELEDKRNEINKLNAKKAEIVSKVKNGEMDKVEALGLCKEIDYDVSDLNRDVNELSTTVQRNKSRKRTFERVIKKLERINRIVSSYKNEPIMLSYLGQLFNFDSAVKVMRGTGTEQDVNNIINIKATITDMEGVATEKFNSLINALNESDEKMYADNNVEQVKIFEQNKAENMKKEAEADDYFNNLIGEKGNETNTNEVENNKNDNANLFNCDDIL